MTPKRKIMINLVVVLLLGTVMVGWVFLKLIGTTSVRTPLKVTADFATSGGVFTNQEVTYRGVLVGKVGGLELNEDGVDIELVIDPAWKGEIPADVDARIGSKSAVGEQFVNLTPRSEGGQPLRSGDVIPRDRTELPVDFQELLQSLDAVLQDVPVGKTRNVIENLADGLRGRSTDIATVLSSLGELSEGFASVAKEQKRLLDNSTVVAAEFLDSKDAFAAAIRAADEVFAGIGDEPQELARLLAENDRLAREGIALLARRGRGLEKGIAALADFTTFQLEERRSVEQALTYVPQFLRAVEESSVPWRSPDGKRFYRIRVGLVTDQDNKASWPCQYKRGERYTRHYFVRTEKKLVTDTRCNPTEVDADTRALIEAMERWAAEQPVGGVDLGLGGAFSSSGYVATEIAFGWPLDGVVTSTFGPRWGRLHMGIDIDGVTGDPVVASAPGVVTAAGIDADGYGNVVVVDHGEGFTTLYAHLDRISVEIGQSVSGNEVLGRVGCTGHCFGDHLHFEIRLDGRALDPLRYLPGGALVPALLDRAPPQD